MGKKLRNTLLTVVVLGLVSAFVAMFAEPFAAELYSQLGIDTSKWVRPMLTFVWHPVTQVISLLIVGTTAGVWLHYVVIRFDRRGEAATKPAKTDEQSMASIAVDMSSTVGPLRRLKKQMDRYGDLPNPDDMYRYAMDWRGTLKSLEAFGFVVPWIDYRTDPMGFIEVSVRYADRIFPLLARGHLADAKSESEKETAESKKYMAARASL